ncbi:DEAD/DEAH box helicase [Bradyrhizobium japonicum]|uniref:DEAD/DEAH box helicase n=1 Tax=Bradyrhizobium japonicum TaxID=375 RepID=UPI0033968A17
MVQHWSKISNGEMIATPALKDAWSVFELRSRDLIINNASSTPFKPSVVLPLPTGSGKTEGTCVYAALQADANTKSGSIPVGVLIVTRLIKDAERLVSSINSMAGRAVAVTSHTENKLKAPDMADADILVITHAAFMRACWSFGAGDGARWDAFHSWKGGKRHLIVVDEALLNSVSHHRVTSKDIELVLRAIPHKDRTSFSGAIATLSKMQDYLDRQEQKHAPGDEQTVPLWAEGSPRLALEIEALHEGLRSAEFDLDLFAEDAAHNVSTVLEAVQVMLEEFAYYRRSGAQHTLNSARYIIPKGMPGVLVLDATARCNLTYELLGGGVMIADVPSGIRNYDNVTLHVARTASGMGKTKMEKAKKTRMPRLAAELAKELPNGRSVFLCVHKCAKDLANTYSTDALPLRVGYWGAVAGSNEWADCDVAVIYGLFWQDPTRPINNVFAIDGPKDASWLKAPRHGAHENILAVISQKDVSASVIQAINRICIRRVTDEQGRCAKADVYIVLPKDWRGDAILQDIHTSMPGLRQVAWDFEPDGPKVYAPRSNSVAQAVIELMRTRQPGQTPLSYIRTQLSLTQRQFGRLKEDLAKSASNVAAAMNDLGILYKVEGKGRATKGLLVKVA